MVRSARGVSRRWSGGPVVVVGESRTPRRLWKYGNIAQVNARMPGTLPDRFFRTQEGHARPVVTDEANSLRSADLGQ